MRWNYRTTTGDPARPVARRAAAIGLALIAAGCNDGRPPLYPASGSVVFSNGAPVRNATIEFVPATPGPSPRALVDAEGRFELGTYEPRDGAPAGAYRVVVAQPQPPDAARSAAASKHEHLTSGAFQLVALRHASPETTGIVHSIETKPTDTIRVTVQAR